MGLLVLSGTATLWHVFVFAAMFGMVTAFDMPFRQSFVSEMVGPERLPNAVALNSATFNTARLTGPAVGGLVIAWLGVGPAFLLNSVTFVAVISAYLLMRPDELIRSKRAGRSRGQLREGLRYVRSKPDLLLVIALVSVVGTMGMNFNLTLPLLAKVDFAVGPAYFGSATLLLVVAGTFGALDIVVAFAPSFVLAALLLVPAGAFLVASNNVSNARMQLGTPAHLRGRVMSLYM